MKNLLMLITSLLLGVTVASAQEVEPQKSDSQTVITPNYGGVGHIAEGMKYKELKHIYDFRDWDGEGDKKYSPFWCGLASAYIPGLGQILTGEWLRGACFFAGHLAFIEFAPDLVHLIGKPQSRSEYQKGLLISLCLYATPFVWNIIDATRIAKVKNMYESDLRSLQTEISVDFYPSVSPTFTQSGLGVAPGMTLAVTF